MVKSLQNQRDTTNSPGVRQGGQRVPLNTPGVLVWPSRPRRSDGSVLAAVRLCCELRLHAGASESPVLSRNGRRWGRSSASKGAAMGNSMGKKVACCPPKHPCAVDLDQVPLRCSAALDPRRGTCAVRHVI